MNMLKLMILDIETDGIGTFRPPVQRPIQISFEICDLKGITQFSYSTFIKGVKQINWKFPYSVIYINKFGIPLENVITEIDKHLDDNTIIVGHNIDFDIGCIAYHSKYNKILQITKYDTMLRTIDLCKLRKKHIYGSDMYKFPKLNELAQKLKVDFDNSKLHRSDYDIKITKKCLLRLLEIGFTIVSNDNKRLINNRKRKITLN